MSPLDLSRTLLADGGLLVPYSLSGSPALKKKTHANGYYGAWPGWAVSISVLPLTGLWKLMDYNVTEQNPEGPSPTSSALVLL